MKSIIATFFLAIGLSVHAQSDTLASGVYKPDSIHAANINNGYISGSTTDLANLKIHVSTLAAGKTNHPPRALSDYDELIAVKDGELKITINDSSKIIGPGSLAMINAGDVQSFKNVSGKPTTYIVIGFKSTLPANIDRGKQAGGSFIKDWNELTVKKTDKGESRPVFDKATPMFARFDIHATTLNPGFESHAPHTHRAEEIALLMKGNITMHIGDAYYPASAGDVVLLRPNIVHNLKNTGNGQCWYYAIQWHNKPGE